MNEETTSLGRAPRIAVVTMGVKLGDETRGYTRFRFLAQLLSDRGFDVTLVTSSFQHWNKAHRDTSRACYRRYPFRVVFIDEPGYKRNLDLGRIRSHAKAAKNMRAFFEREFSADPHAFDLIYAEIPPNDVALACAEEAHAHGVPFVVDVNDLWPEAMRMVVNVPVLSDIAFRPFARDAKRTYELVSGAVGTSDEYAARPAQNRTEPYPHATVYVGNDLSQFDEGVAENSAKIAKPEGEIWATYAGTLGASYDIPTLIDAAAALEAKRKERTPRIRVKILGDGPDRTQFESRARSANAPVDFLGYTPYDLMAAYLAASDITVNSLVKGSAQSIVTKIGDYLAAGKPMINTGESPEFCAKVDADGFGVNVEPNDVAALAGAIEALADAPEARAAMGRRARDVAMREFDQRTSYLKIVELIESLL